MTSSAASLAAPVAGVIAGVVVFATAMIIYGYKSQRRRWQEQHNEEVPIETEQCQVENTTVLPTQNSIIEGALASPADVGRAVDGVMPEPPPVSGIRAGAANISPVNDSETQARDEVELHADVHESSPANGSNHRETTNLGPKYVRGRHAKGREAELSRMVVERERSLASLRALSNASPASMSLRSPTRTDSSSRATSNMRMMMERMQAMEEEIRGLRMELALLHDQQPPEYDSWQDDEHL